MTPLSSRRRTVVVAVAVAIFALVGLPAMYILRDVPVTYGGGSERFRYGSAGTEADSFPFAIWQALPDVCPDKLPGPGWASLGWIYEPGHEQPIGVSRRRVGGIDRMGVNCAACHVGGYSDESGAFHIVDGMPNNRLDFARYIRFALQCVGDPRFEGDTVVAAIRKHQPLSGVEAAVYRAFVVSKVREKTIAKEPLFDWHLTHPAAGPGRFDPPNSLKRMLGIPITADSIGMVDYPSAWNQAARRNGFRHWDANSPSMAARDHVTAVAVSGGASQLVSTSELSWIESWLESVPPPKYPFAIDQALAARGSGLYTQHCALCHEQRALDVTPIAALATDRHRLDSLSPELLTKLNGPGMHAEGTAQYRKTGGYANVLLDGVWGRAPYMHNGSVPTMWDLLSPSDRRPAVFYAGSSLYDPQRMGFVSDGAGPDRGRFKFDTTQPGNGNRGHEYGTTLPDDDKRALVEYLKTR